MALWDEVLPGRVMRVRYEELVADQARGALARPEPRAAPSHAHRAARAGLLCTGPPACAGRLFMPRQGAGRWFAGRARARERRRSSLGRLAGARRRR